MKNLIKMKDNQLSIGDKCLLVRREYGFQNKIGGRIIPARVKTFQNIKGIVEPVFAEIGNAKNNELTLSKYFVFTDLQKAIDSISIKEKYK